MRGQIAFLALIITLLSLTLASCGGGAANIAATSLVEPAVVFAGGESQIPAMPPGGDFNPVKIPTAITAQRDGANTYDFNAANVTPVGPHASFAPAAGELAWAIYEFPGSPADDISAVDYYTSNRDPDGLVWVAISNYTTEAWDYLGSRNQDHGTFNPPGVGDYASEAGHTYVMVLAWDGVALDLDQLTVTYANRYAVTGQVVDLSGTGVPMTTVTTSLGGPGVMTDATGNFTLPSIPDGTWHIMATKPGWVFYDNPQEFTVAGGPASGIQLIGYLNESHFDPIEDLEPNDAWWEAPNVDPAVPFDEFISASDDKQDFYRFAFASPGQYWIRMAAAPQVLFPHLTLYTKEGIEIDSSSWAGSGVVYVPFTVAASRVVLVGVSCSGGGGQYNLATGTGNLHKLEGHVEYGVTTDYIEYVEIECDAGGEFTYLYSFNGNGNFLNNYARPVMTTVTPDAHGIDPYNYAPVDFNANLALGDVTVPDFVGSGMFPIDGFEPNDTKGTAYHFAAMPVAGEACNISGTMSADWYKVSPAAGKHLIVRILYDIAKDYWNSNPVSATIENETATEYSWGFVTDVGYEVRTSAPCDGGDYYIYVASGFTNKRIHFYTLWIEEVDAYELQAGALWQTADNAFGLRNARVDVYNPEYKWLQTFTVAQSGWTEIPFFFKDGEELFVEVFRYGTTLDRYTRKFTIDGDDIKYWFRCDYDECEDAWESNDTYGKYVDYPADFDATISGISDPIDAYLFTPLAADTVHVSITTPEDGLECNLSLYDNSVDPAVWLANREVNGSGDFYFETAGLVEHKLEFNCYNEQESPYHITIDETPGYTLSGTLLDNVATMVHYSYIYCPALDYQFVVYPWSVDGNYEIGPFAPGSYQIYIYGANYASAPGSPYTLNIVGSDVIEDFVLSPSFTDVGEPNNTSGTASGPLASGVPVSANINNDGDDYDYWSFTVGAPGLINSYITFENGFGSPSLKLYDTDGSTELESSTLYDAGYQRIDYNLPAAGTYYLMVSCTGANDYTIAVNY